MTEKEKRRFKLIKGGKVERPQPPPFSEEVESTIEDCFHALSLHTRVSRRGEPTPNVLEYLLLYYKDNLINHGDFNSVLYGLGTYFDLTTSDDLRWCEHFFISGGGMDARSTSMLGSTNLISERSGVIGNCIEMFNMQLSSEFRSMAKSRFWLYY